MKILNKYYKQQVNKTIKVKSPFKKQKIKSNDVYINLAGYLAAPLIIIFIVFLGNKPSYLEVHANKWVSQQDLNKAFNENIIFLKKFIREEK